MRTSKMGVAVLAAVLMGGLAREAAAEWSEMQLTPKFLAEAPRRFTVSTKVDRSLTRFDVTVEGTERKPLSFFTSATLDVVDGDHFYASVPVEARWQKSGRLGKIAFTFSVETRSIGRSKLEIREQNSIPVIREQDANRLPRRDRPQPEEMILGGQAYWFYLKDFLGSGR